MPPVLNSILIDDAVRAALAEDLGRAGDITSQATIPVAAGAHAVIATRKTGVISGLPLAEAAFRLMDPALVFVPAVADGARVKPGDIIADIKGPARSLLSAERVL